MLLKAEKILSHDNILLDKSETEILDIVRRELCEKIVDDMIRKDLVKVQLINEMHDDFGPIVKVRASIVVYSPDD